VEGGRTDASTTTGTRIADRLDWVAVAQAARELLEKLPLAYWPGLALQLHFLSEVSAASVGLVSTPPERPCENTVDRDAPLSELDSDATDFLDRPADQERRLNDRRGNVFLGPTAAALAR
jgi:hypothetical protein